MSHMVMIDVERVLTLGEGGSCKEAWVRKMRRRMWIVEAQHKVAYERYRSLWIYINEEIATKAYYEHT